MKHTRHQQKLCPKCGTKIDSATAAFDEEATPKKGDYSICISCCSVLRYGEDFELLLSSVQEAENEQPGLKQQLELIIACNKRVRQGVKRI